MQAAEVGVELAVEGRAQALGVTDYPAGSEAVATAQPARQAQRSPELAGVAHHLAVAVTRVLDADREVVEPDDVTAAGRQPDELEIRPLPLITKCAQTFGSSPYSGSGRLWAKAL